MRDRCLLATRLISPNPLDGTRILSLVQQPIAIPNLGLMIITASSLCALTIILGLGTLFAGASNFWLLSLIIYVALYFSLSGSVAPLFGRVLALHVGGKEENQSWPIVQTLKPERDFERNEPSDYPI